MASTSVSAESGRDRILLSPPYLTGLEQKFVAEAFASNYIAPVGPMIDAFEQEFADAIGVPYAAAVSSGTAALHLVLRCLGVTVGDEVWASTMTFIGGVSPIVFLGAQPKFFDVSPMHWTLDTDLLAEEMVAAARGNRLPKAVVPTDLYGQSCDIDRILQICKPYGIPVVTNSAEAAGAMYKGAPVGGRGRAAVFSFNGNKIITTSGGGMIVSRDRGLVEQAHFLSQQAREPAPHYEHATIGYNYRLSNIAAAIGRGQLIDLPNRVARRRAIFERYRRSLSDLPGVAFMPEAPYGQSSRWLTVMLIDPRCFGVGPERVRLALEAERIEARPAWKPMHLQPVFAGVSVVGGVVAESLFQGGLCLPSGAQLTPEQQERVINTIRRCHRE